MDFAKVKAKAQTNRPMRWKVVFAVGAWWDKTVTVYVPAPRIKTSEEFMDAWKTGIDLNPIVRQAVAKADELLDYRAGKAGQEPPVAWDLALLSMELG
jgi:hypothetical protein